MVDDPRQEGGEEIVRALTLIIIGLALMLLLLVRFVL